MGVVDDHGVVGVGGNHLDAPGHALGVRKRRGNLFERDAEQNGADGGAHGVIDREAARNLQPDAFDLIDADQEVIHAVGFIGDIFGGIIREIVQSGEGHRLTGGVRQHGGVRLVVGVDHGDIAHFKELMLGGDVIFKVAVIIQMILRQVRKHGDLIMQTVNALLRQRLGGNLHHAVFAARFDHFGEQALHFKRVGRGQIRRNFLTADHVLDRADQTGFVTGPFQDLFEQEAARGLAVRARHADEAQTLRGMTEKGGAEQRESGAGVVDNELIAAADVVFAHDQNGAVLLRLRRGGMAVKMRAGNADEYAARLHFSGIIRDKAHVSFGDPLRGEAGG